MSRRTLKVVEKLTLIDEEKTCSTPRYESLFLYERFLSSTEIYARYLFSVIVKVDIIQQKISVFVPVCFD